MKRTDIINYLIKKYQYTSYLEIGYWNGINFKNINVKEKYAVDPDPKTTPTHKMTSDEFFMQNSKYFDIIFIDGLHHADQTLRDIKNSLRYLNPNGTILCHDMNPTTERMQLVPIPKGQNFWTGDCWKAWVELRKTNIDLELKVIDTDWGIGVIQKNNMNPTPQLQINDELSYDNFAKHKIEWLNLISVETFIKAN